MGDDCLVREEEEEVLPHLLHCLPGVYGLPTHLSCLLFCLKNFMPHCEIWAEGRLVVKACRVQRHGVMLALTEEKST